MNGQLIYIAQAILLLIVSVAVIGLISKIPRSAEQSETATEKISEVPVSENSSLNQAGMGLSLFRSKCASCHHLYKDGTGPALSGFEGRHVWRDRKKLHEWIKNPDAFLKKDPYLQSLREMYGSRMTAFPDISLHEVNAIADYITGHYKGY